MQLALVALVIFAILVFSPGILLVACSSPSVRRWLGKVAPPLLALRNALVSGLNRLFKLSELQVGWLGLIATLVGLGLGVVAVIGIDGGDNGNRLTKPDYARRVQAITCQLELEAIAEQNVILQLLQDFGSDPSEEKVVGFVREVHRFTEEQEASLGRALDQFALFIPPDEYDDEHDVFVAALEAARITTLEVSDRVPANPEDLTTEELLAVLTDPNVLAFLAGAIVGIDQEAYSDEYLTIIKCQVTPIATDVFPTIFPTSLPGSTPTPEPA